MYEKRTVTMFKVQGLPNRDTLSVPLSLSPVESPPGQQGAAEERELAASPMMQVEGFFMALTNANTDGRVVLHTQGTHTHTPTSLLSRN